MKNKIILSVLTLILLSCNNNEDTTIANSEIYNIDKRVSQISSLCSATITCDNYNPYFTYHGWNITESTHTVAFSPLQGDPLYDEVSVFPSGDLNSNFLGPVMKQILDDVINQQPFYHTQQTTFINDSNWNFCQWFQMAGSNETSVTITPAKVKAQVESILCKMTDNMSGQFTGSSVENSRVNDFQIESLIRENIGGDQFPLWVFRIEGNYTLGHQALSL